MREKTFIDAMAALTAMFGGIDPMVHHAYRLVLDPLSDEQVRGAIQLAVTTCKYFPRPAELVALASQDADSKASAAWVAFLAAFTRHGSSRTLVCDDPILAAAVRTIGGLAGLGRMRPHDFQLYARKQFIEAYKFWSVREVPARMSAPLIGEQGGADPVLLAAGDLPKPRLQLVAGQRED